MNVGRSLLAIASLFTLVGCGDESGGNTGRTLIEVTDAWAPATVPAATTGAVYIELRSSADDALVGATVDTAVAAGVSLHVTETEAGTGMMTMSDAAQVELPAGDEVVLEPGGTHLMLSDLAAPLVAGTSFEITLDLAAANDVTVDVEVRAAG